MADLELDHSFIFNDQKLIDIHKSSFFNLDLEVDHSVEEYMERILFSLAAAIDQQQPPILLDLTKLRTTSPISPYPQDSSRGFNTYAKFQELFLPPSPVDNMLQEPVFKNNSVDHHSKYNSAHSCFSTQLILFKNSSLNLQEQLPTLQLQLAGPPRPTDSSHQPPLHPSTQQLRPPDPNSYSCLSSDVACMNPPHHNFSSASNSRYSNRFFVFPLPFFYLLPDRAKFDGRGIEMAEFSRAVTC
ncbi:hypothetical protein M5K25_025875 [Dendrobium thyrsiflorum]|uniref:Uncharacterized protein n=1 Tax=Dendrobium thyrsiflorum TaxID=117978 RepID=A0ABD0TVY2_DENTH